jgi:hypothetical protein
MIPVLFKRSPHKKIQLIVAAVFISFLSFLFGIHWHGTIGSEMINRRMINNLFCYGHTNFLETFQLNCHSPQVSTFGAFKNHMNCQALTNHQMTNSRSPTHTDNEFTIVKADYVKFTLDIDSETSTIVQSPQPGESAKEPYKVIQNDEDNVQAIRTAAIDDFYGHVYEYMTLSKKTGKGMLVWTNTDDNIPQGDSISSTFFQCN